MTYREKLQSQSSDLSSAVAYGVDSTPEDIQHYANRVLTTTHEIIEGKKQLDDEMPESTIESAD